MKVKDFKYDGISLKDLGYMLCNFGDKGLETVTNSSQITLNTVSTLNGAKQEKVNAQYDECLASTFQICKNNCKTDNLEMSVEDERLLMRWLNRKEFLPLYFYNDETSNLYVEASFNIGKVTVEGKTVGLELAMKTNRPYLLEKEKQYIIKNTNGNIEYVIIDTSDEIGHIYPEMEIQILQDGDLKIYNEIENRYMVIKGCKKNEIITINHPMIETSVVTHEIQDDFNWNFFRIANDYSNKKNKIKIDLPSIITIKYSPIVKISI